MDLFPDETGATNPWYLPVTTLVWWLSGLYLSPASAVWLALDSDAHFFSVGHYCIMVAYAAIIAYAINRVRQKQRRVNLKTD